MRAIVGRRIVGGYELLERLSHGRDCELWRAWHPALARPAAVKVLPTQKVRGSKARLAEAVERLVCEAQLTASLRSTHVAQVYDLGLVGESAVFFAMEFLEGVNAEHFVYHYGALDPRRAVRWLQDVCHALGEVHARGLIHGDIKPSNMFVSRRGSNADHITLLDFGSARAAASVDSVSPTTQGRQTGTPGYMAPEQLLGVAVDSRADIYAMGCLAYWLLAGKRPFESEDDEQLAHQHACSIPPSPVASTGCPLAPTLEAVIMRCLSKDPGDRPADAWAVSRELATALEGSLWSDLDAHAWWDMHRSDP